MVRLLRKSRPSIVNETAGFQSNQCENVIVLRSGPRWIALRCWLNWLRSNAPSALQIPLRYAGWSSNSRITSSNRKKNPSKCFAKEQGGPLNPYARKNGECQAGPLFLRALRLTQLLAQRGPGRMHLRSEDAKRLHAKLRIPLEDRFEVVATDPVNLRLSFDASS